MEKVRPWCGQPSDRGRLMNRTEQNTTLHRLTPLHTRTPHLNRLTPLQHHTSLAHTTPTPHLTSSHPSNTTPDRLTPLHTTPHWLTQLQHHTSPAHTHPTPHLTSSHPSTPVQLTPFSSSAQYRIRIRATHTYRYVGVNLAGTQRRIHKAWLGARRGVYRGTDSGRWLGPSPEKNSFFA